jgi:CBS domain-containing protein
LLTSPLCNPLNMRVAEMMTSPVLTASPDVTVREIAQMMLDRRSGSVVIVDRGEVVGIVTRNDLQVTTRRVPQSRGTLRSPAILDEFMGDEDQILEAAAKVREVPASDVMSQPVHSVSSGQSAWDAAHLFLSEHIAHLPVIDDGALTGIVTRLDLLRLITEDPAGD